MSWGRFAIALGLVYVFQIGAASLLGWSHLDPFLIMAVIYGLTAPRHDARIAAWLAGLAQDLGSADALGVHAFTLGLTGLFVTKLREVGNVNVWWVRGLIMLAAAWPGQALYLFHLHYWSGAGAASFSALLFKATIVSAIAAAAALVVTALPSFGRRPRRGRFRTFVE